MFAMYLQRFCTVLRTENGQALIQYASGTQPKWVDKSLIQYIGGQASGK